MKKIITISREFGAGGGTIGRMVAEKLHYDYYDKEIIMKAATQSNVDLEVFCTMTSGCRTTSASPRVFLIFTTSL